MADQPVKQRPGTIHGDRNEGNRRTPAGGIRLEMPDDDDLTDQHAIGNISREELQEKRRNRPTPERVDKLERKHDELSQVVTEFRVETTGALGDIKGQLGEVKGQMSSIPELVDLIKDMTKQHGERETVVMTRTLEVQTAKAMEPVEKAKFRRKLALKVVGIAGGGGAVVEILHKLGVL